MHYSLISVVALLIHFVINYDIIFNKRIRGSIPARKEYIFFFVCSCAFYLFDIAWGILENVQPYLFIEINTYFYFVAMSFLVLSWTTYVVAYLQESKLINRSAMIIGYIVFGAGILFLILNLVLPEKIFFEFLEDGTYVPKVFRFAFLTAQGVMFILTSVYALVAAFRSKKKSKLRYIAIASFGVWMAVSIVVQLFFPNIPIYPIGCIVGTALIHSFVITNELYEYQGNIARGEKEIENVRELAYIDALTGVRNKHAYVEFEQKMDARIRDKENLEFAVFIFDLNDLKKINDTFGHDAGDRYIIKSVEIINKFLDNTTIYRVGGDEFAAILEGKDYKARYKILEEFNETIEKNIGTNEPLVALGFSDFVKEKDNTLRAVYTRADERMYIRKKKLKELNGDLGSYNTPAPTSFSSNLRMDMYEMFYHNDRFSLVDFLNGSSADEILEIDTNANTFTQYFHIQGKYFVPTVGNSYRDLIDFVSEHIVHEEDRGTYLSLMKPEGFFERLKNAKIPNFDFAHFRYKLLDGNYCYVEQVVIAGEENNLPDGVFRLYVFDINNLKLRQSGKVTEEMTILSTGRDPITNLLNSKEFFTRAQNMVNENKDRNWCLISLDIEHFKFFDEWFGRERGDKLLSNIGKILLEHEKKCTAVTGYFLQDDFGIVMEYDQEAIRQLHERIKDEISSFSLTAGFLPAFGIAIIENNMSVLDAFDRASIAASKASGDIVNRIVLYNSNMQFQQEKEYRILSEFIKAIQNDEITFYLQPQCRISTGNIVGAEALARWIKKDGTFVSPAEFVPVLEKYGFICDLDLYIWEKVCSNFKNWVTQGHKAVPISVNVSRIDIFNIDILQTFVNLCAKYDIPHHLIKIEITESAYAEQIEVIDKLVTGLRKENFLVLMDDFGTGYSSLNMLSTIHLDAIKLDAKFMAFEGEEYNKSIHVLESVVDMAKSISLPIIAEGVENKKVCDFLKELGCQYVQGYYFYKPMPCSEFQSIINDEKKIDTRGFTFKKNEQFRIREFLDKNIYSDTMLNSIIGSVAIYLLKEKEHVDILRYNQQFYEAVNLPNEFSERLSNIDQFVPAADAPKLIEALKKAIDNRLNGAEEIVHFYRPDGSLMAFKMHFFYLDQKEGGYRFYGSATNVTALEEYREGKQMIAKYSKDNMIFIRKIENQWNYSVISHGLSDVFGLSSEELEKEMNSGAFAKRASNQKDIKALMKSAFAHAEKKENFVEEISFKDKQRNLVKLRLEFTYVGDQNSNIAYIMITKKIDE